MSLKSPNPRGFTLIELMLSMAIGTIVLLLAATMLGTSGDGYERIGGNVTAEREARALIAQLTSDLGTGYFHKNTVMEKSSLSWPTDRLGFLSLQPPEAQTDGNRIGDLCAVNYSVQDLTINNKKVRCLMRGFRDSSAAFTAVRTDTTGSPTIAKLFDPVPDPSPDPLLAPDEPVAFDVVSFTARPRSRNSAGKWIDWVKNDTIGPDALDVSLVIARRELAGKLKTTAEWNGGNSQLGPPANADRNKYLEIYKTTIRFGNNAKP